MTANPVTAQDALKDCPFCRGSGQRTDHLDSDDKIRQSNVRCKPCGYTVPLAVWNRRADLAQPRNDAEAVSGGTQAALDALGRLSTAYHGKSNSPSAHEAVLHELYNFLKYTNIVHAALAHKVPDEKRADERKILDACDEIEGCCDWGRKKAVIRFMLISNTQ